MVNNSIFSHSGRMLYYNILFTCLLFQDTFSTPKEKFCPTSKAILTWPKTRINSETYPLELCKQSDGTFLKRKCYSDGQWAPIREDCSVSKKSFSLSTESPQFESVYELYDFIMENYKTFDPQDVDYCCQTLYTISRDQYVIDNIIFQIGDAILNTDHQVLVKSEVEYFSISIWRLTMIVYVIPTYCSFSICYGKDNIISAVTTGLIITKTEGAFLGQLIIQKTIDEITSTPNFYCAIITLEATPINYYKSNNLLPQDSLLPSQEILLIFEVNSFVVLLIYKLSEEDDPSQFSCISWMGELDNGLWEQYSEIEIYDDPTTIICNFVFVDGFIGMLKNPKREVTDDLMELLDPSLNSSETLQKLYLISLETVNFQPSDVGIVGQVFEKLSQGTDTDLTFQTSIVNNMQNIKKEVLAESQLVNRSTDSILYYTDLMLQKLDTIENNNASSRYFSTLIFESLSNFTGFQIHKNNSVIVLKHNVDVSSIFKLENVSNVVLLSQELREQLKPSSRIILNVYDKDSFFNSGKIKYDNISKVIDVVLPVANFSGPISIFFRANVTDLCSYWSYDYISNISGFWQLDGNKSNLSGIIQCDYWHTTHFALLILDSTDSMDVLALEYITNITLSLSLFGFTGILCTALLFKSWRSKSGNKILLNFIVSGIFEIALFYLSLFTKEKLEERSCVVIGATLHYFILSQFSWMLVIGVLQFRRFVNVFNTHSSHIVLKVSLVGWGLPFIPVSTLLLINQKNYSSGTIGLCYPSGPGLYFGVWLPLLCVILLNLFFFLKIVIGVTDKEPNQLVFGGSQNDKVYQWRLIIFLFFMLGLTWIFAFIAELGTSMIFIYLFCILATLQGFIMFVFFVLLNENVRDLYLQKFLNCIKK